MSCENIDQQLTVESGRLSPTMYRRQLHTSPWLDFVKQTRWEDEMGQTASVVVWERSLPTTSSSWAAVGQGDGRSNTCAPSADTIEFGRTKREWALYQYALQSPDLNVNDLRIAFKRREQMTNILNILNENTKYVWENRHRDEYSRVATHKVIATTNLPEGSASFPLTVPTSGLTQGILDRCYAKLIRDGGGQSAMDRYMGAPQFLLITDMETSDNIIRENDNEVRTDFRYSKRVEELLGPLGIERPFRGFFHAVDNFGPRWDFVNGAWVRRYPYESLPATEGNKWEINGQYENALYMDSFIFVDSVYECQVPAPISSVGAATFDPQSYRGDWKWLNIQDRTCNPDRSCGFFRGLFQSASKPIFPQYGFVIRHLRCTSGLGLVSCPTS